MPRAAAASARRRAAGRLNGGKRAPRCDGIAAFPSNPEKRCEVSVKLVRRVRYCRHMDSSNPEHERKRDIVKDGEGVNVPFVLRDGAWAGPALEIGDMLRDLDTGSLVFLDRAYIAAIRSEAAGAGMSVTGYLRNQLHYSIERA